MTDYRRRLIDSKLATLLAELPALSIVGPRASGKTTTAAQLCSTVIRMDVPGEADAFRRDPDAALRGLAEPVLLDEWQSVPEVLGAVKRAVDSDFRPGRFVLTGSVRAELEVATWPGTGRVAPVSMGPLTVAERLGVDTIPLVDRLLSNQRLKPGDNTPDIMGYIEHALVGGFPEPALRLSSAIRSVWFESYLEQVVTRDAFQSGMTRRDPDRLARYLTAYALNSAGVAQDKTVYDAAGVNRRTAQSYEQLLTNLFVAAPVPAWTSNRLKRLMLQPKRYLIDPALYAAVLQVVDPLVIFRDSDLLGRLIDTFIATQIRAEQGWAKNRFRLHHLRQDSGTREVDLVLEVGADRVIGIEIKAASSPQERDARHLIWLRDKLGDRFIKGVLLHTGPRTFDMADDIVAAPISTLWASN